MFPQQKQPSSDGFLKTPEKTLTRKEILRVYHNVHLNQLMANKSNGDASWLYTRIYIVGEVEGKDEWWIQIPGSPYYDKDGLERAVNYPKDSIVFLGKTGTVKRGDTEVKAVCSQKHWQ